MPFPTPAVNTHLAWTQLSNEAADLETRLRDMPLSGAGSPEGVVTAPVGRLYVQTDGVGGNTLWNKKSGTGNTGWGLYDNSQIVNVMDYGAKNDNSDPAGTTAAVQAAAAAACAIAAAGSGAVLLFPAGRYAITDTITINEGHVHVMSDGGKYTSTIYFTPTSAKTLFLFKKLDGAAIVSINQCSIQNMAFSGGGAFQKIAVDFYDTTEFEMLDCVTNNWTTTGAYDVATASIALRTNGRQQASIGRCDFYADRPIHIRPMASAVGFSCDTFHFFDLLLGAVFRYQEDCILVDPTVTIYNLVMDGYQAWVCGRHGFNYQGSGAPATSKNLSFKNVRREQVGLAPTGTAAPYSYGAVPATSGMYSILATGNIASTLLDNCMADSGAAGRTGHGFSLSATSVTLISCRYEGNTGGGVNVGLDLSGAGNNCTSYNQIGCFFQEGGTVNMGGLKERFAASTGYDDSTNKAFPLPPTCFWGATGDVASSYYRPGIRLNGKYQHDVEGNLTNAVPQVAIYPNLAATGWRVARLSFTYYDAAGSGGASTLAGGSGVFLLKSSAYNAGVAAGTDNSGIVTVATTARLVPLLLADADVAGAVGIRWLAQGSFAMDNATGVDLKIFYTMEYMF